MSKAAFYGTEHPQTISYLEFGAIDLAAGEKKVWDFRLHQQAYDWLMLARYGNDLATYLELSEMLEHASPDELLARYRAGMHHPNDAALNLEKLCAFALSARRLASVARPVSFFELGQTLFGCIEGMEFAQNCLARVGVPLSESDLVGAEWHGVDISALFNRFSKQLHGGRRIFTRCSWLEQPKCDVFFAKGVTLLYAISKAEQLEQLLALGELCLFDYSFSLTGPQEVAIGTGKTVHYLPVEDFLGIYRKSSRKFYVRADAAQPDLAKNRVFVSGLYAEPADCENWIELLERLRGALLTDGRYADLFQVGSQPPLYLELETFLSRHL